MNLQVGVKGLGCRLEGRATNAQGTPEGRHHALLGWHFSQASQHIVGLGPRVWGLGCLARLNPITKPFSVPSFQDDSLTDRLK